MRIALAQLNTIVGDISGNTRKILRAIKSAEGFGADLVVLPELAIFGYPPKDLVLRPSLVRGNVEALERIAKTCHRTAAVIGFVQPDPTGAGTGIFNSAAACHQCRVVATYAKRLLPTYDVFDEKRYFNPGASTVVWTLAASDGNHRIGLSVCEDLWNDRQFEGRRVYGCDPIAETVRQGVDLLINLSASPYFAGKQREREAIFGEQVRQHGVPLVLVNQVGGNDDLLFDGASLAIDPHGQIVGRAKVFEEDLLIVDFRLPATNRVEPYPDHLPGIRKALAIGTRDYLEKCGFDDIVIGLSGGIDSAVTAAIAVEAVGPARVHGVAMPSRFSSAHSVEDAAELARTLGIDFRVVPIDGVHAATETALQPCFAGTIPGVAEENVQARIRGMILMALSNKFGWLLLTTGNKSEMAVGYCTLYGDMCGGLAVLSDVPKTTVYGLAGHINATSGRAVIPERTITKPPSAELRPNQKDQDTLPPYELLDAVLEETVERERSVDEIVELGFDRRIVEWTARAVERSEYKRKQAPTGLKVTSRAFGTGRRIPIAARPSVGCDTETDAPGDDRTSNTVRDPGREPALP